MRFWGVHTINNVYYGEILGGGKVRVQIRRHFASGFRNTVKRVVFAALPSENDAFYDVLGKGKC